MRSSIIVPLAILITVIVLRIGVECAWFLWREYKNNQRISKYFDDNNDPPFSF